MDSKVAIELELIKLAKILETKRSLDMDDYINARMLAIKRMLNTDMDDVKKLVKDYIS